MGNMFFSIQPYLSLRLFIVLYRIFPSLFTCHSDLVRVLLLSPPSTVTIYSSLYRVAWYLFPLFTSCSDLDLLLLRRIPMSSSDRGIDSQLDSNAPLSHGERVIRVSRHLINHQYCSINCSTVYQCRFCIRTDRSRI